jgi:hypothetical protein
MQTPFMAGEDPMRPPAARADMRLTYEHFVLFPDDGKRHEIIDGEHVVTPSPNVRHQVRLALGSWGETRLRAARRALAQLPQLPLAHWLAATVFVARHALDHAERDVD